MIQKDRPIKVYKYLLENTDDEHSATIRQIIEYLKTEGINCERKSVADDIVKFQKSGFDIICNRSRQNRYFVRSRVFELAELKTIVDAVQAAKFITTSKSNTLIDKLSTLCSPYQTEQLKRNLYVGNKIKTDNETIFYTIDLINNAINNCKVVTFQYIKYAPIITLSRVSIFRNDDIQRFALMICNSCRIDDIHASRDFFGQATGASSR